MKQNSYCEPITWFFRNTGTNHVSTYKLICNWNYYPMICLHSHTAESKTPPVLVWWLRTPRVHKTPFRVNRIVHFPFFHSSDTTPQGLSRTMSSIKVKISYEFAEGLRTTMCCPRPARITHTPYTCQPKKTKVKCSYEYSEGLRTTMEYPQEIVLKHYIYSETQKTVNYQITEIGRSYYL